MSKPSHTGRAASRRGFIRTSVAGSAGLMFLPRTWLLGAQTPPSRRITVAQIGCGRMGMEDLRGTISQDLARICHFQHPLDHEGVFEIPSGTVIAPGEYLTFWHTIIPGQSMSGV